MLGMILIFQIVTGLFLVINFKPDRSLAFQSVQFIMYEVDFGYLFRIFHFNGANLFFVFSLSSYVKRFVLLQLPFKNSLN